MADILSPKFSAFISGGVGCVFRRPELLAGGGDEREFRRVGTPGTLSMEIYLVVGRSEPL